MVSVILDSFAIRAFYVDEVGMDFEMATRNFRKRGRLAIGCAGPIGYNAPVKQARQPLAVTFG